MFDPAIRIGELELRPHRDLRRGAEQVTIGGRALAVLSELAEAGGELVAKDRLMKRVWPDTVVEDNALQAQVSQLRRIMGAEAARLIAVHGRGYRLELDHAGASPAAPKASVAVLPFANLTGDPDKAYLADGMAEEVILTLSRAEGLKVPSRTSSFSYRSREVDIRQIAADLGVETVLEGSIRAAGERIRVTAQLIEAETGFHLWGRNFDRDFGNLFALQDEIAGAIATALKAELGVDRPKEPDFEAYHLYLRARALTDVQSRDGLKLAQGLLDRAVAKDPGFASAYAMRAFCTHLSIVHGLLPTARRSDIREDSDRALALDPQLSWVFALRGLLSAGECDWLSAEHFDGEATLSESCDPATRNGYASMILLAVGHLERAKAQSDLAIASAPAIPISIVIRAVILSIQGKLDEAEQTLSQAILLGFPANSPPASPVRGQISAERGDFATAADAMKSSALPFLRELGLDDAIDATYDALARNVSKRDAGAQVRSIFERIDKTGAFNSIGITHMYFMDWQVRLGNLDWAFEVADAMLESRLQTGFLSPVGLPPIWNPWMRPFREDPRFQGFVRELNLFEYWERYGPPDGHELRDGKLICL